MASVGSQEGSCSMLLRTLLLWLVLLIWDPWETILLLKWAPKWGNFVFPLLSSSLPLWTLTSVFHSLLFSGVTCTFMILPCPPSFATHTWFEYSYKGIDSLLFATFSYQDPSCRGKGCLLGAFCWASSAFHLACSCTDGFLQFPHCNLWDGASRNSPDEYAFAELEPLQKVTQLYQYFISIILWSHRSTWLPEGKGPSQLADTSH